MRVYKELRGAEAALKVFDWIGALMWGRFESFTWEDSLWGWLCELASEATQTEHDEGGGQVASSAASELLERQRPIGVSSSRLPLPVRPSTGRSPYVVA